MTAVVLVSRDRHGVATRIEWFESEHRAYDRDPIVVQAWDYDRQGWWTTSRRPTNVPFAALIAEVAVRLAENPWADVSDVETHCFPEPGAPLEPTPGKAA